MMPSGSLAFAFLNTGTGGTPSKVSLKLTDLGLKSSQSKWYNCECNFQKSPKFPKTFNTEGNNSTIES